MLSRIKSKTLQDLLRVLSGNIVAQALGFLTLVIISRDLGVSEYGIFSLLLAIFTMSLQLSDFGISTSYVKYLSENLSKAREIFSTIFLSKVLLSILITVILFWLAPILSTFLFENRLYTSHIQLISIAIIFHALFGVVKGHLQAIQKFAHYAYLNILHSALKIISVIIIAFFFSDASHLLFFMASYTFAIILVLILLLFSSYKKVFVFSFDYHHFLAIYRLGLWVFLSTLATMIIMRLDLLMLQKLSTPLEVGYYSAAMNIAMIFPLVTASLTTTLLPKMDHYLKSASHRAYISKVLSKAGYIFVLLVLIELIAPFLITLLFGEAYQKSISVFQILLVAFTFGIIINPLSLLLYSMNKAHLLTLLNWIQLPLNYLGNLMLIPLYQADGAALSSVVLRLFGGLYILLYLLKKGDHDAAA